MSHGFAGIAAAFSVVMLALQPLLAETVHLAVTAFWALVLALCICGLFFKRRTGSAND